jgi:hypothetical protein
MTRSWCNPLWLLVQNPPLKRAVTRWRQSARAGALFMLRCDRHGHVRLFSTSLTTAAKSSLVSACCMSNQRARPVSLRHCGVAQQTSLRSRSIMMSYSNSPCGEAGSLFNESGHCSAGPLSISSVAVEKLTSPKSAEISAVLFAPPETPQPSALPQPVIEGDRLQRVLQARSHLHPSMTVPQ